MNAPTPARPMLSELDPGIRKVVAFLWDHGFKTCDSGDGVTKGVAMGCALQFPNVAMITSREDLLSETDRLYALLVARNLPAGDGNSPISVGGCYDPLQKVPVILVEGLDDALFEAGPIDGGEAILISRGWKIEYNEANQTRRAIRPA